MIKGMHGMFRSAKPQELRAFLRDKLKLPATDVGDGWLIFDLPEADLGVHPTDAGDDARSGEHDISFYTDDIDTTVVELKRRGVIFNHEVEDHGYGFVTHFTMPGRVTVQLYEPKYSKKRAAPKPRAKKAAKPRTATKKKKKTGSAPKKGRARK